MLAAGVRHALGQVAPVKGDVHLDAAGHAQATWAFGGFVDRGQGILKRGVIWLQDAAADRESLRIHRRMFDLPRHAAQAETRFEAKRYRQYAGGRSCTDGSGPRSSVDGPPPRRHRRRPGRRCQLSFWGVVSRCVAEGSSLFVLVTAVLELEWVLRSSFEFGKDKMPMTLSALNPNAPRGAMATHIAPHRRLADDLRKVRLLVQTMGATLLMHGAGSTAHQRHRSTIEAVAVGPTHISNQSWGA